MEAMVNIRDIEFHPGAQDWWKDTRHLRTIFHTLEMSQLWDSLHYCGPDGEELQRFDSSDSLVEKCGPWEPGGLYRIGTEVTGESFCFVILSFFPSSLTLRMVFQEDYLAQAGSSFVDEAIALVQRLHTALEGHATMGPIVSLDILGQTYPRPRPPRLFRYVSPGAAATFIPKDFFESRNQELPHEMQALLAAPVPEWAARIEHNQLVAFRWVEDLSDKTALKKRRSLQELWLVEILDPPIHPSYNASGDYQVTPLGLMRDPNLTFYNPSAKTGYKAMTIYPDGSMDDALLAEIASWLADGTLPDSRPLEEVYLIMPSRQAALTARDRVRSINVTGVLYIDDEGTLWDPFPPGPWIELDDS